MARLPNDPVAAMAMRFLRDLLTLEPGGRRQVLAFVCARAESLATVGTQSGGSAGPLFGGSEEEVPQMPPLRSAAGGHA